MSGRQYDFEVEQHSRRYTLRPRELTDVVFGTRTERGMRPWVSMPADSLERRGYVVSGDSGLFFTAPDFDVLLSPYFSERHCFQAHPVSPRDSVLALDFAPAERGVDSEIRGTLWFNARTRELSALDFYYTNFPIRDDTLAGGRIQFLRLADGAWVLPSWWIRAPIPPTDRVRRELSGTLHPVGRTDPVWSPAAVRVTGAELLGVHRAGDAATLWARPTGEIVARVRQHADSMSTPAAGATVWMPGSNREAVTDSSGLARLSRLVEGDYFVEATTVAEDALLLPPQRVTASVSTSRTTDAAFTRRTPDAALGAACGRINDDQVRADTGAFKTRRRGALVGTVRSDGGPEHDVHVVAEWMDMRGTAETRDDGRYRLCGVMSDTAIVVRAYRGDAASRAVKTRLPRGEPFVVLDLDAPARTSTPRQSGTATTPHPTTG